MRIPSVYHRDERSQDVAMTPMIDVVFLLLVFFVWTASFQTVEYLLPSQITSATGNADIEEVLPELLDLEQVVIRLKGDGESPQWMLNDETLIDLQSVEQRLASIARIRSDLPIIIDPDGAVSIGDVIDAYDAAMKAGLSSIRFTTSI